MNVNDYSTHHNSSLKCHKKLSDILLCMKIHLSEFFKTTVKLKNLWTSGWERRKSSLTFRKPSALSCAAFQRRACTFTKTASKTCASTTSSPSKLTSPTWLPSSQRLQFGLLKSRCTCCRSWTESPQKSCRRSIQTTMNSTARSSLEWMTSLLKTNWENCAKCTSTPSLSSVVSSQNELKYSLSSSRFSSAANVVILKVPSTTLTLLQRGQV